MVDVLELVPEGPAQASAPTVKTIMVATRKLPGGATGPQIWIEELPWKKYALLSDCICSTIEHRSRIYEPH